MNEPPAKPPGARRRINSVTPEMDRTRSGWGMVAGLLAAAVAVGVGQLVAGLVAPDSSPVVAVGEASIDLTPPPVKDLAVFAAIVGALAVRRLWYGMVGLAAFTVIGLTAALTRPTAGPAYALATLAGGAAAAIALTLLVRAVPHAARARPPA